MGNQLHVYENSVLSGIVDIENRTAVYWGNTQLFSDAFTDFDGGITVQEPASNSDELDREDNIPLVSGVRVVEASDSQYCERILSRFSAFDTVEVENVEGGFELPTTSSSFSDDALDLLDEADEETRNKVLK